MMRQVVPICKINKIVFNLEQKFESCNRNNDRNLWDFITTYLPSKDGHWKFYKSFVVQTNFPSKMGICFKFWYNLEILYEYLLLCMQRNNHQMLQHQFLCRFLPFFCILSSFQRVSWEKINWACIITVLLIWVSVKGKKE